MKQKSLLVLFFLVYLQPASLFAQTYEELREAVQRAYDPARKIEALSDQQAQVRKSWEAGKLIDDYLLERSERAIELVDHLAEDLKQDRSRIYYTLQFARAYPHDSPPWDLPWGFYQYLLSINDSRERETLAERAVKEKWNWKTLREEIKKAGRDNKEFVFTDMPGETGIYRVMKAKHGIYRGQLVLDLGFFNYYSPSKLQFEEYSLVKAQCKRSENKSACTFKAVSGRERDLFTYEAEAIEVFDGDTFKALIHLGFGIMTRQTIRLWGLDAPEINTKEGRKTKEALESLLIAKRLKLRAMDTDKYGRFLADVWSLDAEKDKPLSINQALLNQNLAAPRERTR